MSKKNIYLVSSGLLFPKKENNILNKRNLYPNYGLISLATILRENGYSPTVIHGDYDTPDKILSLIPITNNLPVLISIPSFFSITWARLFCEKMRKKYKTNKIIAGGKWVVSGNESWLKKQIPEIDFTFSYNAENHILKIIENFANVKVDNELIGSNHPKHLDYKTVYNFKKYQPSVELARGCGSGCSFCLEKEEKYILTSTPKEIVMSILRHQKDYLSTHITPYFQASFFRPTTKWCEEFQKYYCECNLSTKWRTQTRVDSISKNKIRILAKAGLKVLDLGLESGSSKQLLAMQKTKQPHSYLEKASQLLEECYKNNVWVKVNILLYPGENYKTISETFEWLRSNKVHIKGISVNPLFIYKYYGVYDFLNSIQKLGASMLDYSSLEEKGYAFLNLSNSISYSKSNEICLEMRKEMMNERDYYDLKSFSYFDRFYSYKDFTNDIDSMNLDSLPFLRKD